MNHDGKQKLFPLFLFAILLSYNQQQKQIAEGKKKPIPK